MSSILGPDNSMVDRAASHVAGRRGEHLEEGARWRPPPGGLADLAPWLGAANRRRLVPPRSLTQVLKFVSERQVLMEWWSADGTIEWTRMWSHLGGCKGGACPE